MFSEIEKKEFVPMNLKIDKAAMTYISFITTLMMVLTIGLDIHLFINSMNISTIESLLIVIMNIVLVHLLMTLIPLFKISLQK